ncbi:MAG: hypothetical protein LC772_08595 [Chloroflexi bacterium]|nr:hypothetical protein [Chloroflexota bacterium]
MELEKATPGGALVKHTEKQDKIAVGLGAAGVFLTVVPLFPVHVFLGLAAGIGALLLSWESVTASDRRTALAAAAFALGAVPVAFELFGLVGILLKLLIISGIVGGIYLGGRSLQKKRRRSLDAGTNAGPSTFPGDGYAAQER